MTSLQKLLKSQQERFDEIIGEKHYKICEGKKCVCMIKIKSFLLQSQRELGYADNLISKINFIADELEKGGEE